MPSYTLVVMTNAENGRDDEFNEWYNNRHLGDVLKVPGFTAAKRFKLAGAQRMKTPSPYKYLALYEIETDDLAAAISELASRSNTDLMPLSSAMSEQKFVYAFEPIKTA